LGGNQAPIDKIEKSVFRIKDCPAFTESRVIFLDPQADFIPQGFSPFFAQEITIATGFFDFFL
jgi:hypothetical protein